MPGLVRAAHRARGFDRRVDGRMRGQAHFDLREADVQQRAQLVVASARAVSAIQAFNAASYLRLSADRGEHDGFEQRAIAHVAQGRQALREFGLERTLPLQHHAQRLRGRDAQRDAGCRLHAPTRRSRRALR